MKYLNAFSMDGTDVYTMLAQQRGIKHYAVRKHVFGLTALSIKMQISH